MKMLVALVVASVTCSVTTINSSFEFEKMAVNNRGKTTLFGFLKGTKKDEKIECVVCHNTGSEQYEGVMLRNADESSGSNSISLSPEAAECYYKALLELSSNKTAK